MNFRTLIMLAIAALVIVVAIKMNRNPAVEPAPETATIEENVPATDLNPEEVVIEDQSAVETETGAEPEADMTAPAGEEEMTAPAEGEAPADAAVEGATPEAPVEQNATEGQTDATTNGEPLTEEEAKAMEPAVVEESPAEALETGPAEDVSKEPVTAE